MKSCSFTGHRIIPESHIEKLEALLRRAIDFAYAEGCRSFYTGGALGFDTMAAKQLINYRMRFSDVRIIVAVPCRNQSERWSHSEREMYDYILANADEVVFCSDEYTRDCMKKRNEYLANACDLLIAYSYKYTSGAAQTVRMATALGKEVYNLYTAIADENE